MFGGFMKKLLIIVVVVIIITACDLGVDPPPRVGFNDDGSVTLYAAGGIFNNNYREEFDGIVWFYRPPWVMNMSSATAGGAPGTTSTRSWEWDLTSEDPLQPGQGAAIYMLNPIPAGNYSKLTFWARVLEGGRLSNSRVIFNVYADRFNAQAESYANILGDPVQVDISREGEWEKYEIPFRTAPNKIKVVTEGGTFDLNNPNDIDWRMPEDVIVRWTVEVTSGAGRVFIDEIKLIR